MNLQHIKTIDFPILVSGGYLGQLISSCAHHLDGELKDTRSPSSMCGRHLANLNLYGSVNYAKMHIPPCRPVQDLQL